MIALNKQFKIVCTFLKYNRKKNGLFYCMKLEKRKKNENGMIHIKKGMSKISFSRSNYCPKRKKGK